MGAIAALCTLITWYSLPANHRAQRHPDFFGEYHACLIFPATASTSVRADGEAEALAPAIFNVGETQQAYTGKAQMQLQNITPAGTGDLRTVHLVAMTENKPLLPCIAGRWCQTPGECVISTELLTMLTDSTNQQTPQIGDLLTFYNRNTKCLLTITGIVKQHRTAITSTPHTFQFGFGQALGAAAAPSTVAPFPKKAPPFPGGIYVCLHTMQELQITPQHMLFLKWKDKPDNNESQRRLASALPNQHNIRRYHLYSLMPITPETTEEAILKNKQALFNSTGILAMATAIMLIALILDIEEQQGNLRVLRLCGLSPCGTALHIILRVLVLTLPSATAGIFIASLFRSLQVSCQFHQLILQIPTCACIAHTLFAALTASMLAALVPAYLAARRPLWQQPAPPAAVAPIRSTILKALAGIICLLLYYLLLRLSFCLSRPTLLLITAPVLLFSGLLLLLPGLTLLTEVLFVPLLGTVYRIHPMLLRRFISSNRWRGYSMLLSICASLWLYISIHIWSASMLTLFTVPDTIPDMLIRCHSFIASRETTNAIRQLAIPQQLMELCVLQPELAGPSREQLLAKNMPEPNVVLLGISGDQAWSQSNGLLHLPFTKGTPQSACLEFTKPNNPVCVIPDTLAYHAKLNIGDFLELEHRHQPFKLKVVGVVRFPWVWFSKCSGVRVRKSRTSALLFAPRPFLLSQMNAADNQFFWMNSSLPYHTLQKKLRMLAERQKHGSPPQFIPKAFSGGTLWDSGLNTHLIQTSSNQSLNNSLLSRTHHVVQNMTQLPLLALCFSFLAVSCVMKSIHKNRAFEYRILACNGMTSWDIRRLLTAEASLTSLLAICLSLAMAILYAWFALHLVNLAPIFGVITPPLLIPWKQLLPGLLLSLAICGLAKGRIQRVV